MDDFSGKSSARHVQEVDCWRCGSDWMDVRVCHDTRSSDRVAMGSALPWKDKNMQWDNRRTGSSGMAGVVGGPNCNERCCMVTRIHGAMSNGWGT